VVDEIVALLGDRRIAVVGLPELGAGAHVAVPAAFPRLGSAASVEAAASAFATLGSSVSYPIDAVLPGDAGGTQLLIALGVAAATGLPVVDASGAARSVSELTMTSWAAGKVSPGAVVLADGDESVSVPTDSAAGAERVVHSLRRSDAAPGSVGAATWLMSGALCRSHSIPGTVTAARELGERVRNARVAGQDPIVAVAATDIAAVVGRGELADVVVHLHPDAERFDIRIDTPDGPVEVRSIASHLQVWRAGAAPVVGAPDLISVLGPDASPLTPRELSVPDMAGVDLAVVVFRAPARSRVTAIFDAFRGLHERLGYGGGPIDFDPRQRSF